jgi:hypothetical protein
MMLQHGREKTGDRGIPGTGGAHRLDRETRFQVGCPGMGAPARHELLQSIRIVIGHGEQPIGAELDDHQARSPIQALIGQRLELTQRRWLIDGTAEHSRQLIVAGQEAIHLGQHAL